MTSVLVSEGGEPSASESVRLRWSEVEKLGLLEPSEVVISADEAARHGPEVEKILALTAPRRIPVTLASSDQDEHARVLASLLRLPLPEGAPMRSIPASRTNEVFSSCLTFLLSRVYRGPRSEKELLLYLVKLMEISVEFSLAVFSLKTGTTFELFVGGSAQEEARNLDDFLAFCKEDIVRHDRFTELKDLAPRLLGGRTQVPGGSTAQTAAGPIASYACFTLNDPLGGFVGLLHLGSTKNHSFNETVLSRVSAILPIVSSAVWLAQKSRDLAERRRGLLTAFSRFLPEPIIRRLLEEERSIRNSTGRKTQSVILFSDIRSFTSIAERNEAEPVVEYLNRHFQAMVTEITAEGGVIDKFIGDAIVAVFEAGPNERDACRRACRAARNMVHAVPLVDTAGVILEGSSGRIGIGLDVGEVIAGAIGSEDKIAFTVIGEVIGRAEKLESETKRYGVSVLMSRAVADALRDSDLAVFEVAQEENSSLGGRLFMLETG